MQEKKTPRKPLLFYYAMVLIVILLLNTFLFPTLTAGKVTEVDYGTFLSMVDSGKVSEVQIENNQISFTSPEGEGKEKIYRTGIVYDPELTD